MPDGSTIAKDTRKSTNTRVPRIRLRAGFLAKVVLLNLFSLFQIKICIIHILKVPQGYIDLG
jgi:hypothetical protein